MIDQIRNLIRNVQRLQSNLDTVVNEAVRLNEGQILELNTEEQLRQGIRADGAPITPPYTPFTVQVKRAKGQPTDRVTLKDTGAFYGSFQASYGKGGFGIYATDPKAQKLERKYGSAIFGLTDENIQEAIEIVREDVFEKAKKIILAN